MSIYTVFCKTLVASALPGKAWLCCSEALPSLLGLFAVVVPLVLFQQQSQLLQHFS